MYILTVFDSTYYFCSMCVSVQLCPTLCDPMHCSPPGSSVHGIFQARTLEWGAISSISCICRWILYHSAAWEAPFVQLKKKT